MKCFVSRVYQLTGVDLLIDEGPGAGSPFTVTLDPFTLSIFATITVVPEPASGGVLLLGAGALAAARSRRRGEASAQ